MPGLSWAANRDKLFDKQIIPYNNKPRLENRNRGVEQTAGMLVAARSL